MLNFAKTTGTTMPGSDKSGVADSMQTNMIYNIKDLKQMGVLSDKEFDTAKDMVPNPGALRTDKAVAQLMTLQTFLRDKMQAAYSSRLVNPSGLGPAPTAGQDQGTGMQLSNWRK
jgi:hypothetical protein